MDIIGTPDFFNKFIYSTASTNDQQGKCKGVVKTKCGFIPQKRKNQQTVFTRRGGNATVRVQIALF